MSLIKIDTLPELPVLTTVEQAALPPTTRPAPNFGEVLSRDDGTFVIQKNGMPYHVVKDDPIYSEIETYLLSNSDALMPEPPLPGPTAEEKVAQAKTIRNSLLSACDWTQIGDAPIADKASWAVYRQALRDWPSTKDFPDTSTLPIAPIKE